LADRDISGEVDMFGHPVIYRDAKRGRPAHERTAENAKRVSMLFALGRSVAEVAAALGITQPTLRKHYFSEVQQRQAQLDKLEADQMVKLFEQSESGSTSATKALLDKCEDARRARMAGDLVKDRKAQAKPAPKGVKAQRAAEAQGVGGVFRPRQAPEQLIN
jgi:DNA-binding transcriptional ArsR family regulator